MDRTTDRSFLRANTTYATVAIYLLIACLGFGGYSLCLRADGRLLFKLKYEQCNSCCVPFQPCPLNGGHAKRANCGGPDGKSSCGSRTCCQPIPLAMIPSTRASHRTQEFQTVSPYGPALAVPKNPPSLPGQQAGKAKSSKLLGTPAALASLKSTVLII